MEDGYFIRSKDVFYDTDFITERQKEHLLDCDDCPGLLLIESSSTRRKNCLGIEIPRGACQRCRNAGETYFDKARHNASLTNMQLIDRPGGTVRRYRRE